MCNNNGACRKHDDGVMCPSYRVTRNEKDLVRGRANTLRLALSGQLGPDAMTADDMWETMKLCVSCKGCKRECPAGVDMARMKIEVLSARARSYGIGLHEKAVAWLPRYAPWLSKAPQLPNMRNRYPWLARLSEHMFQFSAQRELPKWRSDWFRDSEVVTSATDPDAVILVDTFSRYFEPDNIRAAVAVLQSAGYEVAIARPSTGSRPLCCGRTFLSAGLVDQARLEAQRVIDALAPFAKRGIRIIGLEPSCLLTLRDEFSAMFPRGQVEDLASHAVLFEEFIATELDAGRFTLPLKSTPRKAYVHGHCHQKAFNTMAALEKTLSMVPGLDVEMITASCCGMAGAFGYHKDTIDVSLAMAEESLFPKISQIDRESLIVANGTSCRNQIAAGTDRSALHVARILHEFL
jgi:Fe-S oxidoreductase